MISKTKSKDINSLIIKVKNMAKELINKKSKQQRKRKSGNETLQYTDLDRREKILIGGNNVKVKLDNETKKDITEELKSIGYLVHLLKATTVQKIYQKIIDTKRTEISDEEYLKFRSEGIKIVEKLTPQKKGIYNFKIFVDESEDTENIYNKYGIEKEISVLNLVMLFYNYLEMDGDDQDVAIDKELYQNMIEDYYLSFNFNFEQEGISETVEGFNKQRTDDTDIEFFESKIYEISNLKDKSFEIYYRIKKEKEDEKIEKKRITKIIEITHKSLGTKYREFIDRIKYYKVYEFETRKSHNALDYIKFDNQSNKIIILDKIIQEIKYNPTWVGYENYYNKLTELDLEDDEEVKEHEEFKKSFEYQATTLKKIETSLDIINRLIAEYKNEIDKFYTSNMYKIQDLFDLKNNLKKIENNVLTELTILLTICGGLSNLYKKSIRLVENLKEKTSEKKEDQESIDQATERRRDVYSRYGRHGDASADADKNLLGGAPTKYKSTGQVVYIVYKNKKYKRTIYTKEKGKTKYCKMNNEYILLSKCKIIV
jgi:hypothetical protein